MKNVLAIAAVAGLAAAANAQLVVDLDLGTIGAGSTIINGTTGANNASGYTGLTNVDLTWTGEYVVQFTTTSTFGFSANFLSESADTDTFLLDGLGVTGGFADNALESAFLDFGPESYGVFGAGTYFLSIDTFGGEFATPLTSTFSLDFMLDAVGPYQPGPAAANPPASIDLGVVANEGDIFTIDTFGSDFDTELALFDQAGDLIVNNDDAVGLQSEVSTEINATTVGLGAGTYFFAVGGFNHIFADGFSAVASSANGTASGLIGGQINGIAFSGSVDVDSVQWYSFTVVPAPASAALLGLGGFAAIRRRRA